MRTLVRFTCLSFVLLFAACGQVDQLKEKFDGSSARSKAKTRVTGVLDGIQKGGADTTIDVQRAICLWYKGVVMLEMGTLSRASDLFLVWQNEGNIARHISGFEVTGAEDMGNGAVVVSGTIESRPFRIKVVEGEPLSWIKPPNG